jgi:hypothetical protein
MQCTGNFVHIYTSRNVLLYFIVSSHIVKDKQFIKIIVPVKGRVKLVVRNRGEKCLCCKR